MNAEQYLRDGDLQETMTHLQRQIRQEPANPRLRVFLFQLLAVTGAWERALNQLGVAGELDASTLPMVQTYREALRCEVLRAKVFAGNRSPLVFGDPEPWLALMFQALTVTAAGEHAQAAELRGRALDAAPATGGRLDGQPFQWLMDADSRLGPILEVIVNGRYYWIPLQRIRSIQVEKPEDLRDLVWMPASFTWTNGGETVGLIPTRYPGSEAHPDPPIRLARKTEWLEPAPGVYLGLGQRMLTTNTEDYALMDVRRIELETPEDPATDAAAELAAGGETARTHG
ncbi:type VI secretion system accessory protein TagJ [uncultured Thiocystis sp.]|jgi:type VI secretion system protein ImpE|uniref:type VI secretion system accessory protein TagJ n=1 Tax=uncultured Thiocystis sp. TaxID=1202134 RepID=UPI0025EAFA5C|nr:type VI secretion system accessory protein TagJ [uncultured Thiocystis sp.]